MHDGGKKENGSGMDHGCICSRHHPGRFCDQLSTRLGPCSLCMKHYFNLTANPFELTPNPTCFVPTTRDIARH